MSESITITKEWLERLIEIAAKVSDSKKETRESYLCQLLGYISSAEILINK